MRRLKPPASFEGAKVLQYGRKDKSVRKGDDNLTYVSEKTDQEIDEQTYQQHRCQWEIETCILFFYADISGETSNPMKPITGKIPDESCQGDQYADDHYEFSRVFLHVPDLSEGIRLTTNFTFSSTKCV
jgi:hypothetical protein